MSSRVWMLARLLAAAVLLQLAVVLRARGEMYGKQSITPHDYQSLGEALALSAPSCGYPYVTLDISRITAVQLMRVGSECGTCLRIETAESNYIEDGAAAGLPDVAMATHFQATTTRFPQLPTTSVASPDQDGGYSANRRRRRSLRLRSDDGSASEVRYIYVLAVDTGGRGLDMAQVSFTALFGQSLSPMEAAWFPVDGKYCEDIWRNSTKRQLSSPTSMQDISVRTGKSQAPAGLGPVGDVKDSGGTQPTSLASTLPRRVSVAAAAAAVIAVLLL
ncbi:hypothetical protein H4S06_001336 [Coemansia sp. BCRC 34490]|nr:hypothetical protein H4S06_001336 [Coemansia sp. BCRC 34490]